MSMRQANVALATLSLRSSAVTLRGKGAALEPTGESMASVLVVILVGHPRRTVEAPRFRSESRKSVNRLRQFGGQHPMEFAGLEC